ncbi:hypothetical protein [Runella rosea]|jgi:type VI protein secretion system component VasK|nr:hypothetical protein [Runella rosea]
MIPKTSKPPGQKLVKRMNSRTKWLLLAPTSLVVIGYGLCVFSEAGHLKHTNAPFRQWFLMGTYSLIVINAGISLFGQAVIFRVQYQYRQEVRRKLKKMQKDFETALKKKNAAQGGKIG